MKVYPQSTFGTVCCDGKNLVKEMFSFGAKRMWLMKCVRQVNLKNTMHTFKVRKFVLCFNEVNHNMSLQCWLYINLIFA